MSLFEITKLQEDIEKEMENMNEEEKTQFNALMLSQIKRIAE